MPFTGPKQKVEKEAIPMDIKENIELTWNESISISESGEDKQGKWLNIGGVALKAGKSRNNRVYTVENLKENNDKEVAVFVEHDATTDNVIGKTTFTNEDDVLRHDGKIRNTAKHTDVVEKVKDGLLSVSIGAFAKKAIRKHTNEGYEYHLDGLNIRHLGIVGSPGVKGASIEYAIAESFNGFPSDKDENESITIIQDSNKDDQVVIGDKKDLKENLEEMNMEELEKLQKENEKLKKQLESVKLAEKERLVDSILEMNKGLNKNDLIKESDDILKMRMEYEKKLNVKEEEEDKEPAPAEPKVEPKAEPEGEGVVEKPEEKPQESFEDGVVIEKSGDITMSEKLYKKFNDEIKESIYR